MTDTSNLVWDLQTAFAGAREELPRLHLRNASKALREAIDAFNKAPNTDNLRVLNGAWSAGQRTLGRYGETRSIA